MISEGLENKYIDVFQYNSDGTISGIVTELRRFVNKSDKKYILVIDQSVDLIESSFIPLDLSEHDEDLIELKSLDMDTGVVQMARNISGAQRLAELFPDIKDQEVNDKDPYLPKLVLYRRDLFNALLTHIPLTVTNLTWGIDYLLQVLLYCDFRVIRSVGAINDKVYGQYHKIPHSKVSIDASAKYIHRLLININVRSSYINSFLVYTKRVIADSIKWVSSNDTGNIVNR